jgi:hypothetical protein
MAVLLLLLLPLMTLSLTVRLLLVSPARSGVEPVCCCPAPRQLRLTLAAACCRRAVVLRVSAYSLGADQGVERRAGQPAVRLHPVTACRYWMSA